jgi:SAM-dependent methyltransferase
VTDEAPTFDDRAEWFDAHYATTRGRIRLALLMERILGSFPHPPARVLDAGGGSGAVAVPLAEHGYEVTLLDPSEGMLRVAGGRVADAGVDVNMVAGSIEHVAELAPGSYDAICCHAVLMYLDDPVPALMALRSQVSAGAALSLLEKNRAGLALRPGLRGDYLEATRVLESPSRPATSASRTARGRSTSGTSSWAQRVGRWTRGSASGSSPTWRRTIFPPTASRSSRRSSVRPAAEIHIARSRA